MKKNTVGAAMLGRISGQRVLVSFIESIRFKKPSAETCGHRHDEQNDGKGQLAQLEVIRIDGVGRQCAEIDRQRRTGSRHDQAVAQTGQDRHIGISGGVEEVNAKAAGQRVKPLLDGKVVVRGVDDQHIEEEQADKAEGQTARYRPLHAAVSA